MKISIRSFVLLGVSLSLLGAGISSCRKKSDSPSAIAVTNSKCLDFKKWKTTDLPPGADPSVSAEQGGAGFEKIAQAQGFVTYMPKPEELKYFGDPRAKSGGEFRTIISRYLISFRPANFGQNSNYSENQWISAMCYESLLGSHPLTRDFVPSLATHWKISDDKQTYTFRIDPSARFWSGKPVTAYDVVATWKLIMDESMLEPSMIMVFGKFEEPKALSKYIIEVKSKGKNWRDVLYFSGLTILSADEIGKMTGKEFIDKFQYQLPVGSGEYIILTEDIKKGESYTFTRRDDYWAKDYEMLKYSGNFDQVVCDVVKDNTTLEYEKFKKGEQDYFRFSSITTEKWVNDTTYDALKNGWVQKRRVFTDGAFGTQGFGFNMRKPPFNDIRVRKAFAYLLNREQIIDKLLFNEYTPINSDYPNTIYENPSNEKIAFNPEKAVELLAAAGWNSKNSNGILTKNGKPFVVELGISSQIERFVTPYQGELRKVGIDLQLKNQDGSTLWKNMMERNFEMCSINWGGLQTPNPETSLHSKLADQKENNNLEGFKNKRVDELCDIYDTTFDRSKHVGIIREVDSISQGLVKDVYWWTPRGLRFAFWNKFGMPEWGLSRFTQFGDMELTIMGTWWYDAEKAVTLDEARKKGAALPKPASIEVNYWKNFKM